MDTSGKGGVLRHTVGLVDPQGVRITSFKAPTEEELRHDFLWRIRRALPEAGYIGVFDRSHYEDVLIARVRELADPEEIERRYAAINDFERELVDVRHHGRSSACCTSRADEQKERLLARLDDADQALEVQPRRRRRARPVAAPTARPTRSRWSAPTPSTRRGSSSRATRSGTATSRSAGCCTTPCASMDPQWPEADFDVEVERKRLTDEAPLSDDPRPSPSPATSPRCARAAACPASSRPTTSAPTSASSAAPARACGCWSPRSSSASWPAGSGCAPRGLVALDLDPEIARYEADEEVQDLLNASAGPQPRRRLPARRVRLRRRRCPAGADGGRPGALARRLLRERRPLAGATPTCCSGTATCGSSTTGPRCTSTTAGRGGRRAIPARFAAQPWDADDHVLVGTPPSLPAVDAEIRRAARRAGSSPRCWRRCPTSGSSRCRAPRRPTPCARRTSRS